MRLTRQLRELIFVLAVGPTLIVGIMMVIIYSEQIDKFFGEVLKFLILGK